MTDSTQSRKLRTKTIESLRIIYAHTGERMVDILDRLVEAERERIERDRRERQQNTEQRWSTMEVGSNRQPPNTHERNRTMHTYRVVCKPTSSTEPGAFAGLHVEKEFIETDSSGNEVYEVRSERDIAQALDQATGVISYNEDK